MDSTAALWQPAKNNTDYSLAHLFGVGKSVSAIVLLVLTINESYWKVITWYSTDKGRIINRALLTMSKIHLSYKSQFPVRKGCCLDRTFISTSSKVLLRRAYSYPMFILKLQKSSAVYGMCKLPCLEGSFSRTEENYAAHSSSEKTG